MSLPFAVLGILTYSPMTGYNLGKIFNKSVNYSWTASLSQIYRELSTLEKKGYVSSNIQQQDDRPDKKIYCITEDGKRAFDAWLTNFPEIFLSPKRDEFALRLFFGSKIGEAELIKQFKRFIEEREKFQHTMQEGKKALTEMLETVKINETGLSIKKDELFWHFIAKRAIMTNQIFIQWAEECIKELEELMLQRRESRE
ncbi:transcription regulator padr n-terminal [Lucifera butyrica]|uniref:Transcription regulator padr n-terminal n=1 Tax=Lucifera butyrica TaxID=1351585 RepID=A0A498RED7_9FIRM|nr:PadR family transcriptional regulator [Lucifera butyrica]VBB07548.1 transcription regulator padr n-terminal [Lucifera butyrica]